MIDKVDFYQKKVDLHNEIVTGIKNMLIGKGSLEIDLSEGCDTAYATVAEAGPAIEVEITKVEIDQGMLFGYTDDDRCYDLEAGGDTLLASIDTIYDSVWQKLYKAENECEHNHFGICHFYMGGACATIDNCHKKDTSLRC